MTHALTRILRRTKSAPEPDYLPPYFWHRLSVWWCVGIILTAFTMEVIDHFWDGYSFGWVLLLSFLIQMPMSGQPERMRRRWTQRVFVEGLEPKLNAWLRKDSTSAYEAGEVFAKMQWLAQDLRAYNSYLWSRHTLSIRLTPWEGSGTKFTVYERHRPKRVFTFYHD